MLWSFLLWIYASQVTWGRKGSSTRLKKMGPSYSAVQNLQHVKENGMSHVHVHFLCSPYWLLWRKWNLLSIKYIRYFKDVTSNKTLYKVSECATFFFLPLLLSGLCPLLSIVWQLSNLSFSQWVLTTYYYSFTCESSWLIAKCTCKSSCSYPSSFISLNFLPNLFKNSLLV